MALGDITKRWDEYQAESGEERAQLRKDREAAIPEFAAAIKRFLDGGEVEDFRSSLTTLGIKHGYWGFNGNPQMFLNQLCNTAPAEELAEALRAVISPPSNEDDASQKLEAFVEHVELARSAARDAGETPPALGRIPFFVTFFWELDDRAAWPIYFPSARDALEAAGALDVSGTIPVNYARFRKVIGQLRSEIGVDTWDIESLLWFVNERPVDPTGEGDDRASEDPEGIYADYRARGLVFSDEIITSFLLSLRTKPFVILSGISGTGKTQLAHVLGERFDAPQGHEVRTVHSAPEDDESHLHLKLTKSNLRLSRKTMRKQHFGILPVPERGASIKMQASLPTGEQGELRLNNIDFTDRDRSMSILFFQGKARAWLQAEGEPGQFLRLSLTEDGEIDALSLVPGEVHETEDIPVQRHHVAAVRADWSDPRDLVGFENPILGSYTRTPFLALLLQSQDETDEPYLAVLDEMNLARVEYYFADFLSSMESGEPLSLRPLASSDEEDVDDSDEPPVPPEITLPPNLLFVGTVNVDETTHAFSPKVLDRANVLEFNHVAVAGFLQGEKAARSQTSSSFRLKDPQPDSTFFLPTNGDHERAEAAAKSHEDVQAWLSDLHEILEPHRLHFGYRVLREMCRFVGYALELVEGDDSQVAHDAFDLQIVQKVLPKYTGGRELQEPLAEVRDWATVTDDGFHRTRKKVNQMLGDLESTGYVAALR